MALLQSMRRALGLPTPRPRPAIADRKQPKRTRRRRMTMDELAVSLAADMAEKDDRLALAIVRQIVPNLGDEDPIRDTERKLVGEHLKDNPSAIKAALAGYYLERHGKNAQPLIDKILEDDREDGEPVDLGDGSDSVGSSWNDVVRTGMGPGGFFTMLAPFLAQWMMKSGQLRDLPPEYQRAIASEMIARQPAALPMSPPAVAAPPPAAPDVPPTAIVPAPLPSDPDQAAEMLVAAIADQLLQANELQRAMVAGWLDHIWDEPITVIVSQLSSYREDARLGPLVLRLEADLAWAQEVWDLFRQKWDQRSGTVLEEATEQKP